MRRFTQLFLITAFAVAALLALRAPAARPAVAVATQAHTTRVAVVMKEPCPSTLRDHADAGMKGVLRVLR